ncbi:unnamed protein product [Rhodiola kirilowii]
MELQASYGQFDNRRPTGYNSRAPAVRWVKEWVPQEVVATGGKCSLFKWVNEHTFKALKEKENEVTTAEPEPTTEVLFLCSYEGCGKTFFDVGALRKHAHIHGERQYICHYEGCGRKFLDSSKLKRHFLIHTGERAYKCPHEGCGKAFSLDFNLKSHMKTHSQDNYYLCPFPECGKRYAHEYKLNNHLSSHHDKVEPEMPDYIFTPVVEKPPKPSKASTTPSSQPSSDRPYACPYGGCDKAYIHEYKLNLHLRNHHPGHFSDENQDEVDEPSSQNVYNAKSGSSKKQSKTQPKAISKTPSSKSKKRKALTPSITPPIAKKPWPVKEEDNREEDSEETEEDRDNVEGWRYQDEDDEETEDENL